MKKIIFGILACTSLFLSCSKDNDITVNLITSGKLSVKLSDDQGISIQNTKVKLYDLNIQNDYLEALITDANGKVNFGDVLSGSYVIAADTPKVNNIKYVPQKNIQVISGLDKEIIINVQNYSGDLSLTFKKASYLGGDPFSNLDVILVPSELYNTSYSVATLITKAEFSGKTNSSGIITFKIPSSRSFKLIIYNSRKTKKNAITTYEINKEELKKATFSVDTSMALA